MVLKSLVCITDSSSISSSVVVIVVVVVAAAVVKCSVKMKEFQVKPCRITFLGHHILSKRFFGSKTDSVTDGLQVNFCHFLRVQLAIFTQVLQYDGVVKEQKESTPGISSLLSDARQNPFSTSGSSLL